MFNAKANYLINHKLVKWDDEAVFVVVVLQI